MIRNDESHSPIVLLAEDNPIDLIFLERAIRKANLAISLQVVTNGEEAVSYLAGEGQYAERERYPFPAMLITNVKMPRMTGLELLAWVKQQPTLKNLPVMVMSTSDEPDEIEQVKALGANLYFVKTGSLNDLVEVVKQIPSLLSPLNPESQV